MNSRLAALILSVAALTVIGVAAHPSTSPAASARIRVAGSSSALIPGQDRVASTAELAGSLSPGLRRARRLGALAGGQRLAIGIDLRVRNRTGLARFLRQVYDPHSPLFHRFLSPREFARRFSPTSAQQSRLIAWLHARGLRVTKRFANGLQITADGRAYQVEAAFDTAVDLYRQGTRVFMANARPLSVPAWLAPEIQAVSGLVTKGRESAQTVVKQTGPDGGYTPQDLAKLYDLQPLYQQGITGTGQAIALVEFDDYNPANIATYDSKFNITGTVTRIPVNDGQSAGASLGSGQVEVELDIEAAQAIAPEAQMLVYEASNNDGDIAATSLYNQIVSDDRAKIISISWDRWENTFTLDTVTALNATLEEAAAQGQTVFVAAGDSGAFGARHWTSGPAAKKPAVRFPGSDPWVTTVGGTSLTTGANGAYGSETVWADNSDPKDPQGGGGGLSTIFTRPAWQSGPGVANTYSNGMRQEPDVSADADPNTGYAVYTADGSKSDWGVYGGTSAAAPVWAGYAALVNQALAKPVGFFDPTLYALGQKASTFAQPPFHDITTGTNLYYPATPGWDFASGWGSFDGAALITDLKAMGGPAVFQLPAVDISLQAAVAKRLNGQLVLLRKVNRGAAVYLAVVTAVSAVPANSQAVWHFRLRGVRHTLYHHRFETQFHKSDVGQTSVEYVKVKIPRSAPAGTYAFRALLTVGGVTERSVTRVQVR